VTWPTFLERSEKRVLSCLPAITVMRSKWKVKSQLGFLLHNQSQSVVPKCCCPLSFWFFFRQNVGFFIKRFLSKNTAFGRMKICVRLFRNLPLHIFTVMMPKFPLKISRLTIFQSCFRVIVITAFYALTINIILFHMHSIQISNRHSFLFLCAPMFDSCFFMHLSFLYSVSLLPLRVLNWICYLCLFANESLCVQLIMSYSPVKSPLQVRNEINSFFISPPNHHSSIKPLTYSLHFYFISTSFLLFSFAICSLCSDFVEKSSIRSPQRQFCDVLCLLLWNHSSWIGKFEHWTVSSHQSRTSWSYGWDRHAMPKTGSWCEHWVDHVSILLNWTSYCDEIDGLNFAQASFV